MGKPFFCFFWLGALAILLETACSKEALDADAVVISGTGDISGEMEGFRTLVGAHLNTAPGVTGGRREINWDGIADSLVGTALPADFFNPIGPLAPSSRQRGLRYAAGGVNRFMVSSAGFAEVNTHAAGQLTAFSGNKIFANVGASLWPATFQVPGESTPATIQGLGIVFTDVDDPTSAFVEFFHEDRSLGKFFVPAHDTSSNFSFLGVYFNNATITSVQIGHQGRLTDGEKDISEGGTQDLVALDDLLYSEPVAK